MTWATNSLNHKKKTFRMLADAKTHPPIQKSILETKASSHFLFMQNTRKVEVEMMMMMMMVCFSWNVGTRLFHSSVSPCEKWRLPHVGIQTPWPCDIQQDNFLTFSSIQPAGQDLERSLKASCWGIHGPALGTFVRDRLVWSCLIVLFMVGVFEPR